MFASKGPHLKLTLGRTRNFLPHEPFLLPPAPPAPPAPPPECLPTALLLDVSLLSLPQDNHHQQVQQDSPVGGLARVGGRGRQQCWTWRIRLDHVDPLLQ